MKGRIDIRDLMLAVLGALALSSTAAGNDLAEPGNPRSCTALGLARCPVPFDAVLPSPAALLTWDQATRVIGFRNTYRLYPGDVFHAAGGTPYPLPAAPWDATRLHYTRDGTSYGLDDYLRRESVTGLLILKDGRIAYEYYGAGNTESTLWTSRSVAKSVVSILVGLAIKEKLIDSVDDPVTRYLPELAGSAWDGVRLRDLLQHSSGVEWNENYADPRSDFAHLTACEAGAAPYACVLDLLRKLKRKPGVKPGEVWTYDTGGAWLVGRVLEKATGLTLARYLESRVWSRLAMQSDGVWEALVKGQVDMGGHGFNATLRDYGRFALFVANGGRLGGRDLLPADWLTKSTHWTRAAGSVTPATPDGQFGYQWWSLGLDPADPAAAATRRTARQTFWAEGIYGQVLAINRAEQLIMVQWSTWQDAEEPASLYDEQLAFFDAVSHALQRR